MADKYFRPKAYKVLVKDFKLSHKDLKDRSCINWVNELPAIPMLKIFTWNSRLRKRLHKIV